MIAFSYIVDIALVSSSTLFALNGNKGPLKQIHLNLVWILYEVLLVHLFNKEINHFELLPSSGKLLWYLIWCSFRIPLYFPSKSEKMSSCYIRLEQLPANCNQKSVSGTKLLCQACKKKTRTQNIYLKNLNMGLIFWLYFVKLWHFWLYFVKLWSVWNKTNDVREGGIMYIPQSKRRKVNSSKFIIQMSLLTP